MGCRRKMMITVLLLSIVGILSGFIGSAFTLIAGVGTVVFIVFVVGFVALDIWK